MDIGGTDSWTANSAAPLGAVTDGLGKTVSGVTGGLTDTVGGLTGGLTKALPLEGVTKGLGTTVGGLGQTVRLTRRLSSVVADLYARRSAAWLTLWEACWGS